MNTLLDPAILFFAFGLMAGAVRSNLEIPAPISRFLSLYLLMALGLKGGFALAQSGLTTQVAAGLGCALILAVGVPMLALRLLRLVVGPYDAAALAATYGSVSAVTFVTAVQFLETRGIAYGGHMAAAMALMESPAIILAVVFANTLRRREATVTGSTPGAAPASDPAQGLSMRKVLHESFTDGAQLLLLGSMVVGLVTGEAGRQTMQPFSGDLFKGMLAFFLLDMGLLAARNLSQVKGQSAWLLAYALLAPPVHASLALALSLLFGLPLGDTILLMVLAASASYIAVPAVLRHAIPQANPSLYFGLSLGLTFPLNILLGIPVYASVASQILR
jgi:hypothetical protein